MARNITYRPISKDLEKMVKPLSKSTMRSSLGLEGSIGEFYYIDINDLVPFHNQARKSFDKKEIESLSESIKLYGIRQPLTVIASLNGKYEIISGERRFKAAKQAGLQKIPCIIIEDSTQTEAIALIENIHRKDLHPIELGITYKNLLDKGIFQNQIELSQKISVSKSHVSEYIRYSLLTPEVQRFIIENKITARDKLRSVLKANENGDSNKVKEIIGMSSTKSSNFSVLRITCTQGIIKFQEKGLQLLSNTEKLELKKYLTKLIEKI